MLKILFFSIFLIHCSCCLSQEKDSFAIDKWVNYNRLRGVGDSYGFKQEERPYITMEGDTLIRRITLSAEFDQVRKEETILHGRANGIAISYYPNGVIAEVSYYLNDRIWNVISRADSNGKLYNPGTLHNGNGVRYFFSNFDREPYSYITYENGVPNGAYYCQRDDEWAISGTLSYRKDLVRFVPARRVIYSIENGKRHTVVVDTSEFRSIFLVGHTSIKIISMSPDSLEERPKEFKYIDGSFGDPAVVPRGAWRAVNPKTHVPVMVAVFDDYGNIIKGTRYDPQGKVYSEESFPRRNQRAW